MDSIFDFTMFYIFCGLFILIGIISKIFKTKVDNIIEKTENKASGRAIN